MSLQISDAGVEFIKRFEGFSKVAYPDPGTGGRPYTIGYGTTRVNGKPVELGMTCTEEEALQWLAEDVNDYLRQIEGSVEPALYQSQVDAIASFAYNVGCGNFLKSTLLKKINALDWHGASIEFLKWNRAAGKVMMGLTKRRTAESEIFMRDVHE